MKKSLYVVFSLLIVAAMVMAGCTPAATQAPASAPAATQPPAAAAPAEPAAPAEGKQQVEVFSWWTGGGEAAGLEAMIKVFQAEYPEIEFINAAVAGGAGTNARAVLATRLQAGNAPDSWQGHAGQELIGTYVAASQIEPLNFLYEEEGWLDVMPETLIPLLSQDGNIYSVPVNIHRANVLWYNPELVAAAGISEIPTTLDGFIAALEAVKTSNPDVIPLAMGEQWTAMHMVETILLASLGTDKYNDLWTAGGWESAEVTKALEDVVKVLSYTNSDAASLSWQDASQLVVGGDAAFNIMGDWAEGYFKELGTTMGVEWDWSPVPGTNGTFQFLSDSFVLPVNAPHREAAIAWLKICGSKAGQDAFNPVKGSIPARSDADLSLYDEYLQGAMADWASNEIAGSLTHGVVANDSWKNEINNALGIFLADKNVETFQAALVTACASYGPCK